MPLTFTPHLPISDTEYISQFIKGLLIYHLTRSSVTPHEVSASSQHFPCNREECEAQRSSVLLKGSGYDGQLLRWPQRSLPPTLYQNWAVWPTASKSSKQHFIKSWSLWQAGLLTAPLSPRCPTNALESAWALPSAQLTCCPWVGSQKVELLLFIWQTLSSNQKWSPLYSRSLSIWPLCLVIFLKSQAFLIPLARTPAPP